MKITHGWALRWISVSHDTVSGQHISIVQASEVQVTPRHKYRWVVFQKASGKQRTGPRPSGGRFIEMTAAGTDCTGGSIESNSSSTQARDLAVHCAVDFLTRSEHLPANELSVLLPCSVAPGPENGVRSSHYWLPKHTRSPAHRTGERSDPSRREQVSIFPSLLEH
jgi:hypothetical protein